MKKVATLTVAVALACAGTAVADEYADVVAGATGVSPLVCCDDPNDALGAPDAGSGPFTGFVTLTDGGTLTVNFTDNLCFENGDGASADLQVYEHLGGEPFDVAVGLAGYTLTAGASGNGNTAEEIELFGIIPGQFFNQVRVTSTSDGGTVPGADIDALECFSTLDQADIVKDFASHIGDLDLADEIFQITKGNNSTIGQQFKAFEITITNNTGVDDAFAGLTFVDVVPAEFDLDGIGGEEAESPVPGNGTCVDGACDGVEVLDISDPGCTATGAEHTNSGKSGKPQLQPEIITIDASGLDDGDSCTIKVWVQTDQAHKKTFTPTSCPVTLNDGVKVFDSSMNLLLQDDDSLIFDDGDPITEGICNEAL